MPVAERNGDLVAAYYRLLNHHPDLAVRQRASLDWCEREDAVVSLKPGYRPERTL